MEGTSFARTELLHANFNGACLRHADFTDAQLDGATFAGADITGAVFGEGSVSGEQLTAAHRDVDAAGGADTATAQDSTRDRAGRRTRTATPIADMDTTGSTAARESVRQLILGIAVIAALSISVIVSTRDSNSQDTAVRGIEQSDVRFVVTGAAGQVATVTFTGAFTESEIATVLPLDTTVATNTGPVTMTASVDDGTRLHCSLQADGIVINDFDGDGTVTCGGVIDPE